MTSSSWLLTTPGALHEQWGGGSKVTPGVTPACVSHGRFQVEHVLSEPGAGWRGRVGRVDGALLQEFLSRPDGSRRFVCVCGPTGFTELSVRWVRWRIAGGRSAFQGQKRKEGSDSNIPVKGWFLGSQGRAKAPGR